MTQNTKSSDIAEIDMDFMVDDSHDHEHCEDETIVNTMLEHVFAGANHQMQTAIELTKIITNQSDAKNAEEVFKTYTDALKVVMETSPIPNLLNAMGAELT